MVKCPLFSFSSPVTNHEINWVHHAILCKGVAWIGRYCFRKRLDLRWNCYIFSTMARLVLTVMNSIVPVCSVKYIYRFIVLCYIAVVLAVWYDFVHISQSTIAPLPMKWSWTIRIDSYTIASVSAVTVRFGWNWTKYNETKPKRLHIFRGVTYQQTCNCRRFSHNTWHHGGDCSHEVNMWCLPMMDKNVPMLMCYQQRLNSEMNKYTQQYTYISASHVLYIAWIDNNIGGWCSYILANSSTFRLN